MKPGDHNEFQLHIHDQGEAQDYVNAQPGPLVSFIGSEWDAVSWFPLGTKLYGFMWTGGRDVQAYWTEAHLPDGQKLPVCLVLGVDERGGWSKQFAGTLPGTSRVPKRTPVTVTRRFEQPE
jgi:serine/threonine-protein kinase